MEMNKIQEEEIESVDIKKLIGGILRNWHWFVIFTIVSLACAYLVNRYTQPKFSVNSSVLVTENQKNSTRSTELIESLAFMRQGVNVQNQIGILQSYVLNEAAVKRMNIDVTYYGLGRVHNVRQYKPVEMCITYDTAHAQPYGKLIYVTPIDSETVRFTNDELKLNELVRYGEYVENEEMSFCVTAPIVDSVKPFAFTINTLQSLVSQKLSSLSVNILHDKSSVLTLTASSYSAAEAADYLNALMQTYIENELAEKTEIATKTIRFIDEQLVTITDSLSIAETSLLDFRTENKMVVDISHEGKSLYEHYKQLNDKKAALLIEQKYYKYITNYLTSQQSAQNLIVPNAVGVNDQLLINFILRLNTLNEELMLLQSQSAGKLNPKIELTESQIQNLKTLISENVKNLRATNEIAINDIVSQMEIVNSQIEKLPDNERKLMHINRKFDLNDQIYTYLLEKRAEAGIKQASTQSDIKVLDYARADNAVLISPRAKINYLIALIIGLALPIGIIKLVELINTSIKETKDVKDRTKVPIVGSIGHKDDVDDLVVVRDPRSHISEAFRAVKSNLQYLSIDGGIKCIAVTSTIGGEGKSFCVTNLAATMAAAGKRTLIIGLDMHKPKQHKNLSISNKIGLSSYLVDKCKYEDIINETKVENLYVLPSGPTPPNPAALIESTKLADLFVRLRQEFDFIVVDTPPVALVSDALIIGKYTDVCLFVMRQNYTDVSAIELLNDLDERDNNLNLNILINDAQNRNYGYGYGYYYGGYGHYGYGRYASHYGGYHSSHSKQSIIKRVVKFMIPNNIFKA